MFLAAIMAEELFSSASRQLPSRPSLQHCVGDLQSALDAPSSDHRRHRFCCSSSLSYFVLLSYDELHDQRAALRPIQPPSHATTHELPTKRATRPARRPIAGSNSRTKTKPEQPKPMKQVEAIKNI